MQLTSKSWWAVSFALLITLGGCIGGTMDRVHFVQGQTGKFENCTLIAQLNNAVRTDSRAVSGEFTEGFTNLPKATFTLLCNGVEIATAKGGGIWSDSNIYLGMNR